MRDRFGRMFGSVRVRITIAATAVFAIASVLGAVGIVASVRSSLEERARSAGVSVVNDVAGQLAAGTDPRRVQTFRTTDTPYVVYDENGKPIAGIAGPEFRVPFPGPGAATGTGAGATSGGNGAVADYTFVQRTENGDVVTWRSVRSGGQAFVVAATSPLDAVRRTVDTLAHVLWFALPTLVAAVGLLVWFLVGRALRPVEAIRTEVEDITHTTMHRRVAPGRGSDEVARLANTMNSMLDRLEAAAARQRRFVSDASHELRSPIAALRTDLEVALRAPDATDWDATATRALGETERLAHLVDDLLELARLDEGATRPLGDVDLDELLLAQASACHRDVTVVTDGVSAGRVRGDARQLAQVVRNLVDNACRHARTTVALGCTRDGDHVVLTVDDDGDGIAQADRQLVFERFARLDESRARDDGGAGLGLSVVQRGVAAHGGTVTIGDAPIGGARFEVRLPATPT
jgi:signal transduction histidine kinase